MTLSVVSFAAPWLAWGAVAAVGLPVLAHLLSRTRYREVTFPAARLVQQAVAATSRIETPRQRLLMLLRWLILGLLVLALMRPQWTPKVNADAAERGVALVLLMDASASMQRTTGGASLYDRALREADTLLAQLNPSRDTAAVILVNHAPVALLPKPTAQLGLLTEELGRTVPGYTHADWHSAAALAERLLQDEPRAARLITLSDQQGEPPVLDSLLNQQPSLRVDHVALAGPTDNTAIRLVDVRPYPAVQGQPMTATVEVQHFGDRPLTASLRAAYGGRATRQAVELEPGSTQRLELRLPTSVRPDATAQAALLRVSLESPDAIPLDNQAGIWLSIQEQTRVLVVYDRGREGRAVAERLATMLNPAAVPGWALPTVDLLPSDQVQTRLSSADPATLRTVVLLNQSTIPEGLSRALEAYAQSGGGVVQFVTDPAADPEQFTQAAAIDFGLESLRLFEGPARAGLAALRWPGVGNRLIDERAQPILLDELERVIVAEMPRGRGRLIALNTALRDEPGGLLAEPAFVVLFNELCRYASPGPAMPRAAQPGDSIPTQLLTNTRLQFPDQADATATHFTAPGAYTAVDPNGAVAEVAFVALAPAESDTRQGPPWSSDSPGAAAKADGEAAVPSLRDKPVELWPYVVLAMLALVAGESMLLWRFAGSRKGGIA